MPRKTITGETSTIFRATPSVSQSAKELYEPQMVSIGPYHHNSDMTRYMEVHKHQFLHEFLDRNAEIGVEVYVQQIRGLADRASQFYSEKINFSNNVFVQMLLLDGCFILEFILKLDEKKHDILFRAGWDPLTILSDLLLLENQIPFFILEELHSIVKGDNGNNTPEISVDLKSLIINNLFITYLHDGIHPSRVNGPWEKPHHLLNLYHELSKPFRETNTNSYRSTVETKINYNLPQVIPSASQLHEYRVKLRKKISPLDIFHVTFRKPVMKIPQLVIDSTRRTLLMNLLAFEKCVAESERRWTGLMILMNCIIKSKADLEILQQEGVVLNLFASDDEAIKFVGQLSERLTIDFTDHYYTDIFGAINRHCETRVARYKARFFHQFFNNPWAVISFSSSLMAIVLSTVQTLISVFTYQNRFRRH
ncbi:hypothetical protein LUZ60_013781 [Juncus effusus]|nr:hypothetical protein LUZ60_013781 [Juncus effusus]